MDTKPYWMTSAELPRFPAISNDLKVDVVVVGGGLTGITAAHLLKREGVKVALVEREQCASGDTGHTTAHLTYVTDYRLSQVAKNFGKDAAKAFWEAGIAAIDQIYELAKPEAECEFKWVPGYLHGRLVDSDQKDRESLEQDAALARDLGFECQMVESVPYANRPGIRFENQAKFHPLKYLSRLVRTIPGQGSYVFEQTDVSEIKSDPLSVKAGNFTIGCDYVIVATHNPIMGKSGLTQATLFQSKLALYTSYVLGARLPAGTVPEALFWDTSEPYYYLRIERLNGSDYAIFGGNDEKTGQEQNTEKNFQALEQQLKKTLPAAHVENRWLGQVVETNDGLPFIGESEKQQFIATGFCGNGFTLGTLSACMARDRYLKRKNPWFELFAVDRRKFHGGTWRYIKENLDYPYYLLRDRLKGAEGESVDELKIGEGKILKLRGEKVAAYRGDDGKVTLCSPVCTHMRCIVHWNAADKTWDCPCHGSRFKATGEVIGGPAETPLEKKPW